MDRRGVWCWVWSEACVPQAETDRYKSNSHSARSRASPVTPDRAGPERPRTVSLEGRRTSALSVRLMHGRCDAFPLRGRPARRLSRPGRGRGELLPTSGRLDVTLGDSGHYCMFPVRIGERPKTEGACSPASFRERGAHVAKLAGGNLIRALGDAEAAAARLFGSRAPSTAVFEAPTRSAERSGAGRAAAPGRPSRTRPAGSRRTSPRRRGLVIERF